ncbi:hypothetical protein CspeluHIS016_0105860 [Cutaneotrichosporon spelunceum]|uniref:JmjC domain-containing protein n=1 Tax=Cutaneotrichosporon spelunceum TaxID=1672016 RepID=A0AAD3TNL6_9TREE|nr:hypothetical protein CspeluHIS016_0105860 [Cutaneotrichosporon spelunceum]
MSAELEPGGDSPLDEGDIFASAVRDLRLLPFGTPSSSSSSSSSPSAFPSSASSELRETLCVRIRVLLALARQRVEYTPFHLVSGSILRGYTDATILSVVQFLIEDKEEWRDTVQLLDRAIIVAGAVGPRRLESYLASGTHHPPWPALMLWQSADYILAQTGRGRLVPVECGRAYDDCGWTQRLVEWEGFLRRTGWDVPADGLAEAEDSAPQYLAQTSLFRQFPGLESDMARPDYVWAETPEDYKPPPEVLVNAWIGRGGEVVSPAHTDPYYNCYAQVLGYKRVWLAPPDAAPHMYAYSGQGTSLAEEYMGNTSRVPLLRPALDGSFHAEQSRFPTFFEHVYPRAMEAVLGPGDMLVMPPGWWHAMRGEGTRPCWSVSFWF